MDGAVLRIASSRFRRFMLILNLEDRSRLCLLAGLAFPVVFNGLLVGAELTTLYLESFWVNYIWVAAGELAVCYTLGYPLGLALQRGGLDRRLFYGGGRG